MKQLLSLPAFLLPGLLAAAEEAKISNAEPAGFLLLVLGIAALLLGMKNLRDLRHKRMLPPRVARRRKTRDSQPPVREQQ